MEKSDSAYDRFGGNHELLLSDGQRLAIGMVILNSGPGKAYCMLPWAVDRYERGLRMDVGPTWLIKRMIKHAWKYGRDVFISMNKVTQETRVSRRAVTYYIRRLEYLGYAREIKCKRKYNEPKHYDISPFYTALALCIACDPKSAWSRANGGPLTEEAIGCYAMHGAEPKKPKELKSDPNWGHIRIDLSALQDLDVIENGEQEQQEEEQRVANFASLQ